MSASPEEAAMSIGQVAAQAGVRTSAIRYYEDVGVLPTPERVGGRRRYSVDVLRRLAIIDVAQRAGFTLDEVRELLGGASGGGPAYEGVRALAERKLPEIQGLIERAEAVKKWLEVASACECSTLDVCGLFDDRALGLPERASDGNGPDALSLVAVPARSQGPRS
jgi:MerR family transcriptional regulator, redox-sensitive transcriptional activator SoxR